MVNLDRATSHALVGENMSEMSEKTQLYPLIANLLIQERRCMPEEVLWIKNC